MIQTPTPEHDFPSLKDLPSGSCRSRFWPIMPSQQRQGPHRLSTMARLQPQGQQWIGHRHEAGVGLAQNRRQPSNACLAQRTMNKAVAQRTKNKVSPTHVPGAAEKEEAAEPLWK